MTGYTRQSIASIINGVDITAPPLNSEFNQIQSAFDATTGHAHDGSTGNGPKINLATSLSGYLPSVHGGTGGLNNLTAVTTPLATDDSSGGYALGSTWLNTLTGRFYLCVVNTPNSAVWTEVVGVQEANRIVPHATGVVDIGSSTYKYKDGMFSGSLSSDTVTAATSISSGGTLSATGLSSLTQVDVDSGTIDNTVIGGNTPSAITATTVAANSGFTGSLTGDVTGNVASTGTSTFNNITASGTVTGAVVGNVTGNVTSAGSSTFNDVTISGTLNMDGATSSTIQNLTDPTNLQDAATKNYVDTEVAALVDSSPAALNTLNELAAAINDDASFSTTMTTALAGKVADTGDTMTGDLIMSGATVTGLPLPTSGTQASSKTYTDQQDALQVSKSGDSMSGPLAMGSNKITGLGTPTANTDAATKVYVDGILQSATAASSSAAAAASSEANAAISEANASTSEQLAEDWAIKTSGTVDGTNYSAKYWATQADVAAVASNTTAISTVASNITNVNLTGASIAAVNTVAANITNVDNFFDTYFVGQTAPTTSNVTEGDLWFDKTNQILKVRSTSGWQNAGSSVNGTSERKDYTVGTSSGSYSGSLTTFPVVYDTGYVDVYLNGVKLHPSDFTATDGATIVLSSAAASGDTLSAISYGTFELADHYSKTTVDSLIDDVETLALAGL